MTKNELLALGLPADRLKEFQEIYHRDLRNVAQKHFDSNIKPIREAVESILALIRNPDDMREILRIVTEFYLTPVEPRGGKKE